MIDVKPITGDRYEVTVSQGQTTVHEVTVAAKVHQSLTRGKVSAEDLIKASFEFLLERESNTSILRRFDLPVIGRYFPEYERTMRQKFGA
ncbi:MAG: hypothetical protein KJ060_05050 [Candidatus Hydrogenedentes bacterium]|nr:hypothetical protein [Candidatus Hydrogenedentota bacterium]